MKSTYDSSASDSTLILSSQEINGNSILWHCDIISLDVEDKSQFQDTKYQYISMFCIITEWICIYFFFQVFKNDALRSLLCESYFLFFMPTLLHSLLFFYFHSLIFYFLSLFLCFFSPSLQVTWLIDSASFEAFSYVSHTDVSVLILHDSQLYNWLTLS